jgi:hypothetical protein
MIQSEGLVLCSCHDCVSAIIEANSSDMARTSIRRSWGITSRRWCWLRFDGSLKYFCGFEFPLIYSIGLEFLNKQLCIHHHLVRERHGRSCCSVSITWLRRHLTCRRSFNNFHLAQCQRTSLQNFGRLTGQFTNWLKTELDIHQIVLAYLDLHVGKPGLSSFRR